MNSPHKPRISDSGQMLECNEGPKKKLEIVEDSSNDMFTFLCSHPEIRTTPLRTSFTDVPKSVSRKRSRPSTMKPDEKGTTDDFVRRFSAFCKL